MFDLIMYYYYVDIYGIFIINLISITYASFTLININYHYFEKNI